MVQILSSFLIVSISLGYLLVDGQHMSVQLFWGAFVLSGMGIIYEGGQWKPLVGILHLLCSFIVSFILSTMVSVLMFVFDGLLSNVLFALFLGTIGFLGQRKYFKTLLIWLPTAVAATYALNEVKIHLDIDPTGGWRICVVMYLLMIILWVKGLNEIKKASKNAS